MQTSCGVDNHHVGPISLGRGKSVVGNGCRVGTHLLLDDRHANTLTPDANLLDSSGTESVGSAKINLLARLLKLIGKLADSGGLAHTVDTHNENHVRAMVGRKLPVVVITRIVFGKQRGNLVAHDTVKLGCRHILVAGHTLLNALDDFKGSCHADVGSDESLLKVVEHLVVDSRLAHDGT